MISKSIKKRNDYLLISFTLLFNLAFCLSQVFCLINPFEQAIDIYKEQKEKHDAKRENEYKKRELQYITRKRSKKDPQV